MTIRDCYNACLIELNKVLAPSLLLNDFVYLLNKNIQEYFNKKYTSFEKIQQNTDDLRQLINWKTLDASDGLKKHTDPNKTIYFTSWDCPLPSDYVHILGCRAVFEAPSKRCKDCRIQVVGLNKLDTNQAPQIGSNWYMRPSHNRPYYLIINIEQKGGSLDPTTRADNKSGLTPNSYKEKGERYGNSTLPIMLIICGDDIRYTLKAVEILYLQAPRFVKLTQDDLDAVVDTTDTLEFSDYVCNEIIKQLVTQILENGKDERIQTFIPVNQSIPQN